MKIQVLHNYGGSRTNERRIVPGIYDSTDERLYGLAEYLVENGHAAYATPVTDGREHSTVIATKLVMNELDSEDEPVVIPNDVLRTPDYNDLTMDELRHLLTAYDKTEIDVVTDMSADWRTRKSEIITWLESQ